MATITRPVQELRGFRKIALAPGEKKTVEFRLGFEELAFHNRHLERVVEPGEFRVMVGRSAEDIRAHASFVVRP